MHAKTEQPLLKLQECQEIVNCTIYTTNDFECNFNF